MKLWRKQAPQPPEAEIQPAQPEYDRRMIIEDPMLSADDLLAVARHEKLGYEWRVADHKLVFRIAVEPDDCRSVVNQTSRDVIADYPSAHFDEIDPVLAMAQYALAASRNRQDQ